MACMNKHILIRHAMLLPLCVVALASSLTAQTWTLRKPINSPSVRFGRAMAYDAARQRVFLFNGAIPGATDSVNDMWTWDGKTCANVSFVPSSVAFFPVACSRGATFPVHEHAFKLHPRNRRPGLSAAISCEPDPFFRLRSGVENLVC